ncbi:MAG: hypothetical protein QM528_07665 [Phycisphaerales bacterium]|nr:hypothetical protein [Phycisphaerales bacterium]
MKLFYYLGSSVTRGESKLIGGRNSRVACYNNGYTCTGWSDCCSGCCKADHDNWKNWICREASVCDN